MRQNPHEHSPHLIRLLDDQGVDKFIWYADSAGRVVHNEIIKRNVEISLHESVLPTVLEKLMGSQYFVEKKSRLPLPNKISFGAWNTLNTQLCFHGECDVDYILQNSAKGLETISERDGKIFKSREYKLSQIGVNILHAQKNKMGNIEIKYCSFEIATNHGVQYRKYQLVLNIHLIRNTTQNKADAIVAEIKTQLKNFCIQMQKEVSKYETISAFESASALKGKGFRIENKSFDTLKDFQAQREKDRKAHIAQSVYARPSTSTQAPNNAAGISYKK